MDQKYRQILTTSGEATYLTLSDCRTGNRIAGPVPADMPQDDSRPIAAAFDLRPTAFDQRHLCIELSGGTWRRRVQTHPTSLTPTMVLN